MFINISYIKNSKNVINLKNEHRNHGGILNDLVYKKNLFVKYPYDI
jgi:hypothetical protein